jgi:hypothetical protein
MNGGALPAVLNSRMKHPAMTLLTSAENIAQIFNELLVYNTIYPDLFKYHGVEIVHHVTSFH